MNFNFNEIKIIADGEKEKFAAELFCEEIEIRTNKKPPVIEKKSGECFVELKLVDESESEDFSIQHDEKNHGYGASPTQPDLRLFDFSQKVYCC